jgi:hypothetical protein
LSPFRSDGSQDDQVGEAGPVEQKLSRGRESKLRDKGLSDYHSNEIVVEAARQGASGPNKRATLTTYLLKNGELKSSSLLNSKKGKRQPAREKAARTKKKDCLL